MRGVLLFGLLVALGCDSGTPDDTGDGGSGSAGSSGSTTATTSGSTSTSGSGTGTTSTSTTGSSTSDVTTGGTDTGGSTGAEGTGSTGPAGPLVPGDCRTLLEDTPTTPTGIHTVRVGGQPDGVEIDVYCDMDTDGGGWTLVGRSVLGASSVPFGWFSSTGTVDDDLLPYSLDAGAALLDFSEILIGGYTTEKTWGPNVYKVAFPMDFKWIYTDAPVSLTPITVVGDCNPTDGPSHLRLWGFTELPDRFWFGADLDLTDGLEYGELDSNSTTCATGGVLDGLGGMVFVR